MSRLPTARAGSRGSGSDVAAPVGDETHAGNPGFYYDGATDHRGRPDDAEEEDVTDDISVGNTTHARLVRRIDRIHTWIISAERCQFYFAVGECLRPLHTASAPHPRLGRQDRNPPTHPAPRPVDTVTSPSPGRSVSRRWDDP